MRQAGGTVINRREIESSLRFRGLTMSAALHHNDDASLCLRGSRCEQCDGGASATKSQNSTACARLYVAPSLRLQQARQANADPVAVVRRNLEDEFPCHPAEVIVVAVDCELLEEGNPLFLFEFFS